MPLANSSNLNAFLGAAVLGVISAAGMYLVEHYRQEKTRHQMAKDLARLDQELGQVRRELDQLLTKKRTKPHKARGSKTVSKANSMISGSEDYMSASNLDSSDLEFYDLSDDEPTVTSSTDLEKALKLIDQKLNTGSLEQLEDALGNLRDLCMEYPEHTELLWRIGKAHHKIADCCDDQNFIREQISKGIDACELALKLKTDCPDIHKWYAILVGSRSEYVSLQDKISDGHLFKKHVDAALALNPSDPSLHHMLGRFDYEIAGLKWYERKVAAALFGEPPNATYTEALEHFMEAEELANFEWKENKMMIAKCKVAIGEYKEAVEWLERANGCKLGDNSDDKIDTEVNILLDKYKSYK
ncbi:unnamed protein product [Phaedon cochleariae]|uniref:Regulator of microtubule dynamics protein 1 n=1 Tax=Phaedon cochleariae TaxID=80249 RepID=A0A9P0DKC5_PHACE|nr:unnamed protein product [Phaedon cochleariae]